MNFKDIRRYLTAVSVLFTVLLSAIAVTDYTKDAMEADAAVMMVQATGEDTLTAGSASALLGKSGLDEGIIATIEQMESETVMASWLDETVEAVDPAVQEDAADAEDPAADAGADDIADGTAVPYLDIEDAADYLTVPDASSIELPPQTVYTVPSVDMVIYSGDTIQTDELTVDIEAVKASYASTESPKWDSKGEFPVVNTIYHFLVDQMGVSASIAAGMCGNFYAEGYFGMEQGTYHVFTDYEDAVSRLGGSRDKGYGIVQWTSKGRRQNILNYYTAVYHAMPDEDFSTVMMVAELCCAYEEVKYSRDIFSDMGEKLSIEDATGRIALLFERYKDCTLDWEQSGRSVALAREGSSGSKRLKYATDIYDHFN